MITRREFVAGVACTAVAGKLIGQDADTAKKELLVASCGLYCGACAMYLATQEKDQKRLESVLKQGWYGAFMASVSWEDIQCDGCLSGGRLASFCRECAIRDSATDKTKTRHCSGCADFACDRITRFSKSGMPHHYEALENLRQLRTMGITNWTKYEEDRWRCSKCGAMFSWFDPECPKCKSPRSDKLFPLKTD